MEHQCDLAERIGKLLSDEKTADMTFIVEGESLPAHRAIFITSSDYFRALLQGNMKESLQKEVVLEEVPPRGFKLVMSYVYTGQLKLKELDENTISEVLEICHQWDLRGLETSISRYLKENLSIENVVTIYKKAHFLRIKELCEACHIFMMDKPNAILENEALWDLSETAFFELISRDTFCAKEIDIFKAASEWRVKHQQGGGDLNVLKAIRLPLIDVKDLVTTVKDSGLFPTDVLFEAIRTKKSRPADVNFRGCLESDVNLSSPDRGALRLKGVVTRGTYVTGKICPDYDREDMPPPGSEISFVAKTGLMVALSKPYFVNNLKFRPCADFVTTSSYNREPFKFSYCIEVSMNLIDWARIIDPTKYKCRKLQQLFFEPRFVRYIRLIVTWTNQTGGYIGLRDFEVTHTTEAYELRSGFCVPLEDMVTVARGASVNSASCYNGDALIADTNKEDSEKRQWTWHHIGSGSVTIMFPQPFMVHSMRMLLKDDESQAYLFYIETSVDEENWTRVADHTTDLCRSWQNMVFEARPVLWIRIVGTLSTANKEFSFSCFQCPAPSRNNAENPSQEYEVDISPAKRQRVD